MTKIIVANIIAAITNTAEPASSLNDDDIDKASRNTFATMAWDPSLRIPYVVDIRFSVEPQKMAYFFRRPPYREWISIGTQPNAPRIVACLLNTSSGPNSVDKSFLPRQFCNQIKAADYVNGCTAIKQAVHIYGIIQMFVKIGDFRNRSFIVVENLTIDVLLGTCFIDCCIGSIFPSQFQEVPWHSRLLSLLSPSPTVSSLFWKASVSNVPSAYAPKFG